MLDEKGAIELLVKYCVDEKRIEHSKKVAAFAFNLATKIQTIHPELHLNPQKVKLAALLHDIGRSQSGDHEINSREILKSEGLDELAALVMHGTIYEIMKLRGIDDKDLLPGSLENKIVAYSDARVKDHEMSLEERWAEISSRRKNESEKIASIQMAKQRYYALERELLELTQSSSE